MVALGLHYMLVCSVLPYVIAVKTINFEFLLSFTANSQVESLLMSQFPSLLLTDIIPLQRVHINNKIISFHIITDHHLIILYQSQQLPLVSRIIFYLLIIFDKCNENTGYIPRSLLDLMSPLHKNYMILEEPDPGSDVQALLSIYMIPKALVFTRCF